MMAHAAQLLRDTSVASIAPTSSYCAKKISSLIAFESAKVIIEFGPGDGALTDILLKKMRSDAKLLLIETNPHFIDILKERYDDPRVVIVHDSAEKVSSICQKLDIMKADYVVSGIPFSFLSMQKKKQIIRSTASILKNDGSFIIYQALTAPLGGVNLKKALSICFDIVHKEMLLWNLPPLYVWEAKKFYDYELKN